MTRPVVIPLVALVLIAGSSLAFASRPKSASIPDSNGVIHGCFRKSDGRLRAISTDRGQTCARGERKLNWNQTGTPGQDGDQGPEGPEGPQGEQGIQGPAGAGSPSVERVVASFTPATESSSSATWTQPANTVSHAYYRVTVTTPEGACDSHEEAGGIQMTFAINGDTGGMNWFNKTIYPGTMTDPAVGGYEVPFILLPGDYEFTTDRYAPATLVADCSGTVVKTEVFVETVGG